MIQPPQQRTSCACNRLVAAVLAITPAFACAPSGPPRPSSYILAWAADADSAHQPFAVFIDADPASSRYGEPISSVPAGEPGADAHHTELVVGDDATVWANSFSADATFLLDLTRPGGPTVLGRLAEAPGFTHPHSFHRLPDGRLLVTYQLGAAHHTPGGLAEHDARGAYVRGTSAIDPASVGFVRPYSLAVLSNLDRIVTTGADMHGEDVSRIVQIWRLSDLELLHTIELPDGPRGGESAHSFEPRVLEDGSTVLVVTLGCGLYRLHELETNLPRATLVHDFGARRCFMPAVIGNWWIQAVASEHAIVVLDVSDPAHPRQVHRFALPDGWRPHWLATDSADRIVVTGYGEMAHRLLLLRIDRGSGILSGDREFGSEASNVTAVNFEREAWPHGATGAAIPHGAVFVDISPTSPH
ncbi:MAG TPA: hypothetical protein VMN78_01680 [Longimicrobiales bacterium]|nr:hypothetical protein [Longimicrobiales bacterium]